MIPDSKRTAGGRNHTGKTYWNLLLKYPLGISDSWYMNRIKHMIETGEIKVVKEADEIFRRSIRKEQ